MAFDSLRGLLMLSPGLINQGGKVCVSHWLIRPLNWGSVISFRMGWKSPLCLQGGHSPSLKGTHCELLAVVKFVKQRWCYLQCTRLCIWTDHTLCPLLSRPKILNDIVPCMLDWILEYFWLWGSIDQDIDIWMLMHYPIDPVMPVVTVVRVVSHRNECLLLMWVFRLWFMSLTGTMNYLWIVKDLLVIAVALSSWNQPGLPPSWGNSGKQILISKSLIVGRKSAKRNCCGKMCRLRIVLWRLCGHSGSGCFSETVCFVTNGKVAEENRQLTWLFFSKASDRLLLNLIIQP